MYKKTVTYNGFDGREYTEDLYFDLDPVELISLDDEFNGLENHVNKAVADQNPKMILDLVVRLIEVSYGVKSEDGRHFFKSEEKLNLFKQSAAYKKLIVELMTSETAAIKFYQGITPEFLQADQPQPTQN